MYLAVHGDGLATIEEIARAYGVSKAHITKVVHDLGGAGFVETVRGRGGGLQLGCAPEEIRLGEVVRFTEDRLDLVECFDPATSHCRIESVCRLKSVLAEALEAFLRVLDRYTLADLVARRRGALGELLAIS